MLRIAAPRILYIVDAAVSKPPKGWAGIIDSTAEFAYELRSLGCNGVVPLELANAEDNDPMVINKLADVSAVYLEDGNPYYLMYQLRRTGSDAAIKDFMNYGGLYGGSGAGAIVAGSSLAAYRNSREEDDLLSKGDGWDLERLTTSFQGLGLLNNKSVVTIDSDHNVKDQDDLVILQVGECWIKDKDHHGGRFGCKNTGKNTTTKTNTAQMNTTKTLKHEEGEETAKENVKKDATKEAKKAGGVEKAQQGKADKKSLKHEEDEETAKENAKKDATKEAKKAEELENAQKGIADKKSEKA